MDQHGHQGAPGDLQDPYTGLSHSSASQEDEIRHLRSELDQAQRDARSMSNDIRELVAGIRDLSNTLIRNNNSSMNTTHNITTVNPNAESTRLDGTHSHPQDSPAPRHTKPKADNMDQHGHQGAPSDLQGPYTGLSHSSASQEDEIRHLRSELDQARRDVQSMSNDIRELVAGIRDLSNTLI